MNKVEFLLQQSGEIVKRTTVETPMEVTDAIINSMSQGVERIVWNAFTVKTLAVHLRAGAADCSFWTIPLPSITLRTSFQMDGDCMTPMFTGEGIELSLEWTPPAKCFLYLLALTKWVRTQHALSGAYLYAFDANARCWRLPASNMYDDCRICLGAFDQAAPTAEGLLSRTLDQFHNSNWNRDLWATGVEPTRKLFRFKPQGAGFSCEPPIGGDWTSLCQKVGGGFVEKVVV